MQQPTGKPDSPGSKANLAWYLILFFALFSIGSLLVVWREVREESSDSWLSTAVAVGNGLEWVVVVAGGLSYAVVEGAYMLAAKYREQLWARGMEKGREKGREEGREKGREETLAQIFELLDEETRKKIERHLGLDKEVARPGKS